MYDWKVVIWTRGGHCLAGKYSGVEADSGSVAVKLFSGKPNDFTGIGGMADKHNLFVKKDSVVGFDISPWQRKDSENV